MRQRMPDDEFERAVRALLRDGYDRRFAEQSVLAEWAEAHGQPLGCCDDAPIGSVEDLVAAYGEQALRHPIERARFGLPPLSEAEARAVVTGT